MPFFYEDEKVKEVYRFDCIIFHVAYEAREEEDSEFNVPGILGIFGSEWKVEVERVHLFSLPPLVVKFLMASI